LKQRYFENNFEYSFVFKLEKFGFQNVKELFEYLNSKACFILGQSLDYVEHFWQIIFFNLQFLSLHGTGSLTFNLG
jgi:hypothetical protein